MVKRWLALVAACLLSSCSVAVVRDEKVEQTKNVCEADAECGGGQCVEGRCAAQKGTFETVLFEVTAPSDANAIAGVRFLKRVDNIPTEGGQLDLSLGHVADVTGRVVLPPVVNQNPAGSSCTYRFLPETGNNALSTAPDGSIPATLVFTPSERLLGLPASSYTAEAAAVKNESGAITSYGFRVRLAPGLYDIYLKPGEPDPASCTVPPQELLAQMIDAGDVKFDINLPPPQHLTVTVEWGAIDCPPEGCATLNGWTADIIDPVTGRVLSNTATLLDNKSLVSNGVRQYSLNMDVSTVVGAEPSLVGQELFRLSPPAELAAPTLLVTRTVIELSQRGVGVVNQFQRLPPVVNVQGQVLVAGTADAAGATVTFVATQLDFANPGTFASYVRTVDTDAQGNFQVPLLPGTYRVNAVPAADSGLAATEVPAQWEIHTMQAQCCRAIELMPAIPISGTVLHPSGEKPITGAPVQAIPAPATVTVDVLKQALGEVPFVPRATTVFLNRQGNFNLMADPGVFDLSVRPDETTGFAFLVRPNLIAEQTPPGADLAPKLGEMRLPLPVVYQGKVSTPVMGGIAGALIRAYIYTDSKAGYTPVLNAAASVLQVAETRADDAGQFELLLPAQLSTP